MTTVLVVDDDAMVRESTKTFLETQGYNVLCARDGHEALENALDREADVALIDIFMPNLDGFETIKSLQCSIPIIAMSGVSSVNVEPLALAQNLGAQKTLSKPFKPQELLNAIDEVL